MGELPYHVQVKMDDNTTISMVVYWCEKCDFPFLSPEIIETPTCPICGSADETVMDIEYT